YFRLVLAVFLHFGFRHFIANMLTLLAFGPIVERTLGTGRFLLTYLLAGILGNLLSFLARPDVESVRAGASGAVLGLIGALVGARVKRIAAAPSRFKTWHVLAAGAVLYAWIAGTGHADHIAHLGGALGGCLITLLLPRREDDDPERERRRSMHYTLLAAMIFLVAVLWRVIGGRGA
ncbi:MAG: rhomboid family intramembrane serine protease, partial [Deltaproteobacteria bacterium]